MMEETWLMPGMPDLWRIGGGPGSGGGVMENGEDFARQRLHEGSLYRYARFEQIYRCPEFERKPPLPGAQRLFNYTRTWLGRKLCLGILGDSNEYTGQPLPADRIDGPGIAAGKIVRLSQAYAPAAFWMLLDERTEKHCGADPPGFNPPLHPSGLIALLTGMPMCADPVHTIVGDEMGQFHGVKGRVVETAASQQIPLVLQGSIAYYDGHVGLYRDPLPNREIQGGSPLEWKQEIEIVLNLLSEQLYAQRGRALPSFEFPEE